MDYYWIEEKLVSDSESDSETMSGDNSGISDHTRRLLLGAAVATATAGIGYLTYRSLKGSHIDDLKTQLEAIKAEGNALFKAKNYVGAANKFSQGIAIGEEKQTENELVAMLYQNRAACREKCGESAFDVLNDCLAAVKNDRKYAKAYLRAAKQLHVVGKKSDALTYLLAAFTLDQKLNQSNFAFFEDLLKIDLTQSIIPIAPGILDRDTLPVSLFRIQQWWDTWDMIDLFKKDAISFTPNPENDDEVAYRKALDQIQEGEYEQVAYTLASDDILYPPAQILRAKFMNYSIQPSPAVEYAENFGTITTLENIEDPERRELILEAYQILKLELCLTVKDLEEYLEETAPANNKDKRCYRLSSFAAILTYNGCVLDLNATTHEEQMMADTRNCAKLIGIAAECQELTPHLQMMQLFIHLCSTNEYSELHQTILKMEETTTRVPTHFILVLMAKVYMMTGNNPSAIRLLAEAAYASNARYLVAARNLQAADLHLAKPEEERAIEVSRCARAALEVDEFNHSAHILLLLGTNGPEPSIKQSNYEDATHHIQNAALFAPPRELLMLKRMLPLMDAKKRAAQLLGIY